jgi:predicted aconitase with swiveling domain
VIRRFSPLVDGAAEGEILRLSAPICFWGGVMPSSGRISDPDHPDCGASVTGRVLAIPAIVGSSSSSQLLLELFYKKTGPAAAILGEADAILAMASLVGREMGFGAAPILQGALDGLETGDQATIEPGGRVEIRPAR